MEAARTPETPAQLVEGAGHAAARAEPLPTRTRCLPFAGGEHARAAQQARPAPQDCAAPSAGVLAQLADLEARVVACEAGNAALRVLIAQEVASTVGWRQQADACEGIAAACVACGPALRRPAASDEEDWGEGW